MLGFCDEYDELNKSQESCLKISKTTNDLNTVTHSVSQSPFKRCAYVATKYYMSHFIMKTIILLKRNRFSVFSLSY